MKLVSKDPRYKQGIFVPYNRSKYKGRDYPRYLSSWELKLFRWCDLHKDVLEWCSECIRVPYLNPIDNKVHTYIVDAVVKLKTNSGIKNFLIEVKPYKQTINPILLENKRKKKKTIMSESLMYIKNSAKWAAAEKWCKKHGYEFLKLTEKDLKI